MNSIAEMYRRIGEPYAVGLFEEPDKSYFYRQALGQAHYFDALPPAKYEPGELLYPCKTKFYSPDFAVKPALEFKSVVEQSQLVLCKLFAVFLTGENVLHIVSVVLNDGNYFAPRCASESSIGSAVRSSGRCARYICSVPVMSEM